MKRKIYSALSLLLVAMLLFSVASCTAKKDAVGEVPPPSSDNLSKEDDYFDYPFDKPVLAPDASAPELAPDTGDEGEDTDGEDEGTDKFLENPFVSTDKNNVSTLSASSI